MIKTIRGLRAQVSKGNYKLSHGAWCRGYMSRKPNENGEYCSDPIPYKGIFGEGYKVFSPSWGSTQYCRVSYYIKVAKK